MGGGGTEKVKEQALTVNGGRKTVCKYKTSWNGKYGQCEEQQRWIDSESCGCTVERAASPNSLSSFLMDTTAAVFLFDSLH